MGMEAEPLLDSPVCELGEGAIWDARARRLLWVDILGAALHELDPATGRHEREGLPEHAGTVVPCAGGGVVLALRERIAWRPERGRLVDLMVHKFPEGRFNDGKCDPAGRLWVGAMRYRALPHSGGLYCLDLDGSWRLAVPETTVSNGLAWSLDGRTMYYIDSPERRVDAFDFDAASGTLARRRPCAAIPEGMGVPDGMCVDSEGLLWVALWDCALDADGRAVRIDPASGRIAAEVLVPGARRVTSCAFAGGELRDLYLTSASTGLDEKARAKQPHAGRLFRLRPGARGVESFAFRGRLPALR